jgi:hypothetical protein
MGRKEYLLKITDEYSGYSWDYFMSKKSCTHYHHIKETITRMKARGIRVKTVRCDNAK